MNKALATLFAPPQRASAERLADDARLLKGSALLEHLTQTIPCILLVLNEERQIVFENERVISLLGASATAEIIGQRPGEVLHCVHASESAGGCGTTEYCRECGAVNAVLRSRTEGRTVAGEFRTTADDGEIFEFRVWASPFEFAHRSFTTVNLLDVSDEKRRLVLERTFFHDINNTLSVMLGYASVAEQTDDKGLMLEYVRTIQAAGGQLTDEISSQRRLLQAERGELALDVSQVNARAVLSELVHPYAAKKNGNPRRLTLDGGTDAIEIATDLALLRRVLSNMVKNALEATAEHETVHVACERKGSCVVFSVHNPGVMPRATQLQVFQRSFSTKGKGRGLGTYSMKLFGEKFLGGKVWFTTRANDGTCFYLSLPRVPPSVAPRPPPDDVVASAPF